MLKACDDGAITVKNGDSGDAATLARAALSKSFHQIIQLAKLAHFGMGLTRPLRLQGRNTALTTSTMQRELTFIVESLGGIDTINRALEAGGTVTWKMPSEDS